MLLKTFVFIKNQNTVTNFDILSKNAICKNSFSLNKIKKITKAKNLKLNSITNITFPD